LETAGTADVGGFDGGAAAEDSSETADCEAPADPAAEDTAEGSADAY